VIPVLFFIVPVVIFGTETMIPVLFVVVHVLFVLPVVVIPHVTAVIVTELLLDSTSQLSLTICIVDHEFCVCTIFFNSFPFT